MAGDANIVVDVRDQIGKINRHIYGHFIEHLGRCIYGGKDRVNRPIRRRANEAFFAHT